MKSRFLKIYRAYSYSFNSSNVGIFFCSWILKDCIKVQEKKKKVVVLCSRNIYFSQNIYLLLPYSQSKTVSTIRIIQQGEPISPLFTLKKVLKTYELENASSTMAKNVLKPPFHTAGPISRKVARARSKKKNSVSHQKGTLQHIFHLCAHPRRPRGSQSGREKRRNESFQVRAKELFRPYFKTFVPPFLPTQLTAPGSPRMVYGASFTQLF